MKVAITVLAIAMLVIGISSLSFAGNEYVIGASSKASVASTSGSFGNGGSLSLASAGNTSTASVINRGSYVQSDASSNGGTTTLTIHGAALAGQSGNAFAKIIKFN